MEWADAPADKEVSATRWRIGFDADLEVHTTIQSLGFCSVGVPDRVNAFMVITEHSEAGLSPQISRESPWRASRRR